MNPKGPARWHEPWWIQMLAAVLWAYGLIFTIEFSTDPIAFRIAAGAACALLLYITGTNARQRWRADRAAALRRAAAPDIERIP